MKATANKGSGCRFCQQIMAVDVPSSHITDRDIIYATARFHQQKPVAVVPSIHISITVTPVLRTKRCKCLVQPEIKNLSACTKQWTVCWISLPDPAPFFSFWPILSHTVIFKIIAWNRKNSFNKQLECSFRSGWQVSVYLSLVFIYSPVFWNHHCSLPAASCPVLLMTNLLP